MSAFLPRAPEGVALDEAATIGEVHHVTAARGTNEGTEAVN